VKQKGRSPEKAETQTTRKGLFWPMGEIKDKKAEEKLLSQPNPWRGKDVKGKIHPKQKPRNPKKAVRRLDSRPGITTLQTNEPLSGEGEENGGERIPMKSISSS